MTSALKQRMTDYLLGELSETGREAFERKFFNDPAVFDQLLEAETALVDDYVRRRLPPDIRERFEAHYLSHPRLRDRVDFAHSLEAKIDEIDQAAPAHRADAARPGWHQAASRFGRRRAVQALAAAAAILMVATGWLLVQNQRLHRNLRLTQSASQATEQREREVQRQLAAERARAESVTSELRRLRTAPPAPATGAPAAGASSAVVSLVLSVGATRGSASESTPTLMVPAGTGQVRVELRLGQADEPAYRVGVKSVGGEEIVTRQHLRHRLTAAGPAVVLTIPANRLTAGDYVLTVSSEPSSGAGDDIGKWLFRIKTP